LELSEGLDGEGDFFTYGGIAVFDDGAIEIYCDNHDEWEV
jgi:hypothetical protein